VQDGEVRLQSRGAMDATAWWPEVASAIGELQGHHVLDGEMCVLDELGRSNFDRLQARSMRKGWKPGADPIVFCAFDLMVSKGRSVMNEALRERKAALRDLLRTVTHSVLNVGYIADEGEQVYRSAMALELEGIVAKHLESPYLPGVRSEAG
jgi:bifunctional non-homologous end joining protein LigD